MADSYSCCLCAEVLRDPVPVPCGDVFCRECIGAYWDRMDRLGVYSCPRCHATFTPRPILHRTVPGVPSGDPPSRISEPKPFPVLTRESLCDFCTGRRNRAVKSCLVCLAHYCEKHIQPHYESATFRRHKLVDEMGNLDRKICPQHEKSLELFCRSDQMCICVLCTVREHRGHDTVSAEDERADKQKLLAVTQSEVHHIIQERMKELQELRHNVEVLKESANRAQSTSDKLFSEMLQSVERWHAEICQLIQANQQAAMVQAESYVERLEQEILELKRQDAELRQMLDTQDNIHFLQNFLELSVTPEPAVPKVKINQEFSFDEVTKTASNIKEHLDDICKKEMSSMSKKVSDIPVYMLVPRSGASHKVSRALTSDLHEPKTRADFLRYAVRLTFDPNTAYKELILSDGNRRVVRKRSAQLYRDHPERFDGFCQVLCAEPLSGSRYYWEADWSGDFSMGVAYRSLPRKGKNSHCLLGYNERSWSLLCSDSGFCAWHDRVDEELLATPSAARIGVFLDHPAGSVSFYAASENMELIHRFRARFFEPLYAGFGVGASVTLCPIQRSIQTYH